MKPIFPSSSRALRPSPLRSRIAWTLAIAVLVVQTLGALHRVAHIDAGRWLHAELAAAAGTGHGSIDALFGHAGSSKDCDAFDQMSHGSTAVAVALDLGSAPPVAMPAAVHPAWHIAAQARGFLARGPPATA